MKYISIITIVCLLTGCGGSNADPVLLSVDGRSVEQGEFIERYSSFLRSSALPDNLLSRYTFCDALVDEILFLQWADSSTILAGAENARELAALEEQLLLDRLYEQVIINRLQITDDHYRRTYKWSQTTLHTRHLFARDEGSSAALYERLLQGEKWAKLARQTFTDPVLAGNGGDLGFRKLGDLDPQYELAAYGLADGEFSPPIRTGTGYSIIQVIERDYDPFLTEGQFQRHKSKLRRIIIGHLKEPAVRAYTDSVLAALDLDFNDLALAVDLEQLQSILFTNDDYPFPASDAIFVTFTGGQWMMEETVYRLRDLSDRRKSMIDSRLNLHRVVSGLIVREQLLAQARAMKIDRRVEFLAAVERGRRRYKISRVLDYIAQNARVPEAELQAYYNENSAELYSQRRYEIAELVLPDTMAASVVWERIEAGEAFEQLAQELSLNSNTGAMGGYVGWGDLDQFNDYREVLVAAGVGAVVGPVSLPGQVTLVKLLDQRPGRRLGYSEARPTIEQRLTIESGQRFYREFRRRLSTGVAVLIDSAGIKGFILPKGYS